MGVQLESMYRMGRRRGVGWFGWEGGFFSLLGQACLIMDMCVNEGSWLWMNTHSLFDMILDGNGGFKKDGKLVTSWWTQTRRCH